VVDLAGRGNGLDAVPDTEVASAFVELTRDTRDALDPGGGFSS